MAGLECDQLASVGVQHGKVVRGYLGLHGRTVPLSAPLAREYGLEQSTAVEVLAVDPGTPADAAGIDGEDLIVSLGGRKVTGSGTYYMNTGFINVTVPLSAQACFPTTIDATAPWS